MRTFVDDSDSKWSDLFLKYISDIGTCKSSIINMNRAKVRVHLGFVLFYLCAVVLFSELGTEILYY